MSGALKRLCFIIYSECICFLVLFFFYIYHIISFVVQVTQFSECNKYTTQNFVDDILRLNIKFGHNELALYATNVICMYARTI